MAQQKALGLLDPGNPASDSSVTFAKSAAFDFASSDRVAAGDDDFAGIVAREFSNVMGRSLDVGMTDSGNAVSYRLSELYHYSAPGVRDPTTSRDISR